MSLTADQREQVATELKRFAGDLNLTDEQKEKLHAALAEGREKVEEYLKNNPNTTKADIITVSRLRQVTDPCSQLHDVRKSDRQRWREVDNGAWTM
jgi:hypothetical protein